MQSMVWSIDFRTERWNLLLHFLFQIQHWCSLHSGHNLIWKCLIFERNLKIKLDYFTLFHDHLTYLGHAQRVSWKYFAIEAIFWSKLHFFALHGHCVFYAVQKVQFWWKKRGKKFFVRGGNRTTIHAKCYLTDRCLRPLGHNALMLCKAYFLVYIILADILQSVMELAHFGCCHLFILVNFSPLMHLWWSSRCILMIEIDNFSLFCNFLKEIRDLKKIVEIFI